MNALLATADGRIATGRTVRWAGAAVLPAVAVAAGALGRAASGAAGAGPLGDAALAVAASALAFAADDLTAAAAPATPVGTRARLVARLVIAAPVVAAGWLATLTLLGAGWDEAARRAPGAAVLGLAATALAVAVAARAGGVGSPGAVGAGLAACAALVAPLLVPDAWWRALPTGSVGLALTATGAVAVLRAGTAEPPAR